MNGIVLMRRLPNTIFTAGNRQKQNSWFCKEIREDNFGVGGGEFTKTLRKVCTCQKLKFSFLLLDEKILKI
jgi:hypothetical protein